MGYFSHEMQSNDYLSQARAMKHSHARCLRVAIGFVSCLSTQKGIAAPAPDLVSAAKTQIGVTVHYDGQYRKIAYPGGDVPLDRGVCTDVIIRAFRGCGIDLQKLVHDDMVRAWELYPNPWRMKTTDRNIDHRRVPNLATFFKRHGKGLPLGFDPKQFLPGDIVTWRLPSGLPHIGLVSSEKSPTGVPLIIHNIGDGTKLEDRLFAYPLTGHYRYP
jgi:uncharacterized protein YijF (DUF1287 family)